MNQNQPETNRPDFVGDGYDPEPLMTAKEVGEWLQLPTRSVYELAGLPRIRLGPRRIRYRPADVRAWIDRRAEN